MLQDGQQEFQLPVPKFMTASSEGADLGDAIAPMPGVIEVVNVEAGTKVEKGDPLVIMIAMKMEVRQLQIVRVLRKHYSYNVTVKFLY